MKTGGQGGTWITIDKPKPPPIDDRYRYWGDPPPELSERCRYWLRQLERGWRPNKHIRRHGYDSAAEWYGVYIWEYINEIDPRVRPIPDHPRNLLILTRAASTVGAELRRGVPGAALLRILLGDEPKRDDRVDDEAY